MERLWVLAAVAALLTGCGAINDDDDCVRDNPLQECEDDGDTGTSTPDDDATVASFSFAEDMSTVTVRLVGLDTSPVDAVYTRNDRLTEVMGLDDYVAYSVQEDALDRFFLALGGMSPDGSVSAVAVGDGGQFNNVFQDADYARDGAFDPPDYETDPASGQVTYVGNYAAVTNLGSRAGLDLKPVGDLPDDYSQLALPGQPAQITGVIFLNANFADALVNGEILNRTLIDIRDADPTFPTGRTSLDKVVLTESTIDELGEFTGGAEFEDESSVGTFAGIFGGEDATYAAGTTDLAWHLSAPFGEDGEYDIEEVGMFVLTQCGKAGAREDICDLVNP
ncbi:hypothetical protein PVT71_17355 [Salipiger sp. H15]|uniref:Thymidylate synthase n=1 Tax=Alloyangia sp. H15 TaxID=3029062 RepID=A0AAU8ANU5_9RHOB